MALGWREPYVRYKEFFLNISALYKKRADIRAFLEIILSLSTITIFISFALKPTALTIISLLREIQEKKTTVSALTQKVNNLQTAGRILGDSRGLVPSIDQAVSTNPNPDVFSKQISGLASKNATTVLGISFGETVLVGTLPTKKTSSEIKSLPSGSKEMPFSISLKGDYLGIISFINDFNNSRIASRVDSLGISSSETDTGRVIVAIISGRVPYLGR
jgi:hypothetical protein